MATVSQNILFGLAEEKLEGFADSYFDSCVSDVPYGLKFMGKKWDYEIPPVSTFKQILRVLKPGAHILIACGTRTQHRMASNIEDAGFEIRDVITWHYGSGFPKNLDIIKSIKKELKTTDQDILNTENWDGYGTALKPATEFWTLARKPIDQKTIAQNVLKHGTGGLNLAACKIPFVNQSDKEGAVWGRGTNILGGNYVGAKHTSGKKHIQPDPDGRFPANLILDELSAKELDMQAPKTGAFAPVKKGSGSKTENIYGKYSENGDDGRSFYDAGLLAGASRFFYCAKSDTYERNKGCEHLFWKKQNDIHILISKEEYDILSEKERAQGNVHVTVKPINLMRWLVKLITPKYGHCLDPFNGSGTTGIACKLEFLNYTGIEKMEENCIISQCRLDAWNPERYLQPNLF